MPTFHAISQTVNLASPSMISFIFETISLQAANFRLPDFHNGQCKRTGGCYNELVVAFFSIGGGVKGKKIYIC